MEPDKKTKYTIRASITVNGCPEGSYSSKSIVTTTRENETQEIDAIPAAAFHAAKEAVQGALIGMGTNPARIGLGLPDMLEDPALPEGDPEPELPLNWRAILLVAAEILGKHGHEGTARGIEAIYKALSGEDAETPAADEPDGLEEQDDPDA